MKKKIAVLLLMLVLIIGFYRAAFGCCGGSSREDPNCDTLPEPTNGPIIDGTFTAALDQSECGLVYCNNCIHYNVHVVFTRGNNVHLFSFPAIVTNDNICNSTDSSLQSLFARTPCDLHVGSSFGIKGTPVVYSINIKKRDFCDDHGPPNSEYCSGFENVPERGMISGKISVRFVPE